MAASSGTADAYTVIGSAPATPPGAEAIGALATSTPLSLEVSLNPSDPQGLSQFVQQVSTPGSALYRHYLTPSAFAARFGASQSTIASVESTLSGEGLSVGTPAPDGLSIPVTGTAATVGSALRTSFHQLKLKNGAVAYANAAAPQLPSTIAGNVQGLIGLDDIQTAQPLLGHIVPLGGTAVHAATTAQKLGAASSGGTGAGAVAHPATNDPTACSTLLSDVSGTGYLTANNLASAYSIAGLWNGNDFGAGVTVAVYEAEPYSTLSSDVSAFDTCYGISPSVTTEEVDGGATGSGSPESPLDVDTIISLAPLAHVIVYQGPNTDSGDYDIYQKIVDDDTAQVISTSWGLCEAYEGSPAISAEATLFAQAAAQGQTVAAASGDQGSEGCDYGSGDSTDAAVSDPASQPDVTGVGGTTLAVSPSRSESGWSDGGGGVSQSWTMPSYQSGAAAGLGVIGSDASGTPCGASSGHYCREVPDVSANANPSTGYTIYWDGGWYAVGGTSGAAPLWSAVFTLGDSYTTCSGSSIGLANPALYSIAGSNYSSTFNDITSGDNGTFSARTGYDMVTGLGTPIASGLVPLLCGDVTATAVASPTSVTANGTSTSTVTVTLASSQGTAESGKTVTLTAGSGHSVIVGSPATTNGSGAATFTVSDTHAETVSYTATDTSIGTALSTQPTVTFTPGPTSASVSTAVASPTITSADGHHTATITVTLLDAHDNPISGDSVTLTAGAGSSVITGSPSTSNASGVASFTVKDNTAETVTYTAKDTTQSLTLATTPSVQFEALSASNSTAIASPTSVVADGATSSTITVTLLDANGDPVEGDSVSLSAGAGSSVITGSPATSNASGAVSFTVTDTQVETVTYTATDTTRGTVLATHPSVDFSPGPAVASVFSTEPGNGTSGSALATQPVISLKDDLSRTASTSSATVTLSVTGAAISCNSNPLATSGGVASFSGCVVTGQPGVYALTASVSGLSTLTSTNFVLGSTSGTPFFTSSFSGSAVNGQAAVIPVTASGSPSPTIAVTSTLPSGVSFSGGSNGSGDLDVASSTSPGSFAITLTATNAAGTAEQSYSLAVVSSGEPTSVVATASATPDDATLDWAAPGNVTVDGYSIVPTDTTTGSVGTAISAVSTAVSQGFTGLVPGDSYTFAITTTYNGSSTSQPVTSNVIVPVAAAPAATATGNTSDSLTGTTTASLGSGGSSGSISASATGQGTVIVATYSGNPTGSTFTPPSGTSSYDVAVTAGSVITDLSFEVCGDSSGVIYWYNPATATTVAVSPAPSNAGGDECYEALLSSTSTPTIAQLTGSVFFVLPPSGGGGGGGGGSGGGGGGSSGGGSSGGGGISVGGGGGGFGQVPQTIVFTSVPPSNATVGGTYTVSATASSGEPVTFSIDPTATAVCTVNGSSVSFIASGTCVIDASQSGSTFVAAAELSQSFTVSPGSQAISFTSNPPTGAKVGDTYSVSASSTVGLPVNLLVDPSATSICQISGSTVSFLAPGNCVLDAQQPGNSIFGPAAPISQSIAVAAASAKPPVLTPQPVKKTGAAVGPSVSLGSGALSASPHAIAVVLVCHTAPCVGTASLTVTTPRPTIVKDKRVTVSVNRTVASAAFSASVGKRVTVELAMSTGGKSVLSALPGATVNARLLVSLKKGKALSQPVTLSLRGLRGP